MAASTLIHAGWFIDGTGRPTSRDVLMEILDGTIVSLRPLSHGCGSEAEAATDYSQSTLIPGLVDCHVHVSFSAKRLPAGGQRPGTPPLIDEIEEMIVRNLKGHLGRGVFAVRDGGDHDGHTIRYKRESLISEALPIRLLGAGKAWHAPGRYGRLFGRTPLEGMSLAQSILKQGDGGDHVKIIHSGPNSLSMFGESTAPQFSAHELKDAVSAAHSIGLKVMIHANGREAVGSAIDAGCDSIEHGFFMGGENLMKMADKGITWVPTAFTMEAYVRGLAPGSVEAETARRNLAHQLGQMGLAREYGVAVATGTDAGSPGVDHGDSLCEEIRLFTLAGFSMEEAIRCATSRGSALLGLQQELGVLSVGGPASFVVLKGGPDTLLDALASPEAVYVKGKAIKPDLAS